MNSLIRYSCDEGFFPSGVFQITCTREGWSHPAITCEGKENNRVFSQWLSLNSANSMNHDKVQNWSGYQMWYLSGNRYITSVKFGFSCISCV